jgi:anti-sigma B factor antagonist
MTMNNRQSIIRISPCVNSEVSVLELPGPEYSSHDDERLGQVRSLIQDLAEKTDHQCLVIDLSRIHFFGASFIGILVNAWDQLKERKRRLAICGLTPYCANLIQVLRLDRLFDIYPTREVVLEKISPLLRKEGQETRSRQNRLEISEVDWDKNLVRLEFVGDDNVPIRSIIERREEMKLGEALRSVET